MASSPARPSTPDTMIQRSKTNRSFSVPAKIASNTRPAHSEPAIGEAEGIETLLAVPNANVIKFTTTASRPSTASASPGQPAAGTLPWASLTERTIAAGPLEIYRVPGSVSFLRSGSLLHAIMPRSQCWCVDGVSKFAFRVLPDTYYRIELPSESSEDLQLVEQMKLTFAKVLFYERTPCPFSRTFTVDLPDEEPQPEKRRRRTTGPAKKWKLQRAYSWKPEGQGDEHESSTSAGLSDFDEEDEQDDEDGKDGDESGDISEMADDVQALGLNTPTKPSRLAASRAVTAPPHLSLRSTPPSKVKLPAAFDGTGEASMVRNDSTPSQLDPSRLRTFQAIPVDMPPSPPDSSAGLELGDTPTGIQVTTSSEAPKRRSVGDEHVGASIENDMFWDGNVEKEDVMEAEEDEASDASVVITDIGDTMTPCDEGQKVVEAPTSSSPVATATPASPTVPGPTIADDSETVASALQQANENDSEDAFAQIRARIQARRSIGGTTTAFQPPRIRHSTSSASSTATLASDRSSIASNRRRSQNIAAAHQQALAAALVNRACAVFLGPPAYLVQIMLRIAKRISEGAYKVTTSFVVRERRVRVPGSFNVEAEDERTTGLRTDGDDEDEASELDDDDMDDFGVPLRSPIRVAMEAAKASAVNARRNNMSNRSSENTTTNEGEKI